MLHLKIDIPLPKHKAYTYRELGYMLQQVIYREFFPDTGKPKDGQGYPIYTSYDPAGARAGEWMIEDDTPEMEAF